MRETLTFGDILLDKKTFLGEASVYLWWDGISKFPIYIGQTTWGAAWRLTDHLWGRGSRDDTGLTIKNAIPRCYDEWTVDALSPDVREIYYHLTISDHIPQVGDYAWNPTRDLSEYETPPELYKPDYWRGTEMQELGMDYLVNEFGGDWPIGWPKPPVLPGMVRFDVDRIEQNLIKELRPWLNTTYNDNPPDGEEPTPWWMEPSKEEMIARRSRNVFNL